MNLVKTIILGLLLISCAQDEEYKAKRTEEHRMEIEMDHSQCVSYGFPPESEEYNNCRKRLEKQRSQPALSPAITTDENSLDRQMQERQMKNPGKVCTRKYCY